MLAAQSSIISFFFLALALEHCWSAQRIVEEGIPIILGGRTLQDRFGTEDAHRYSTI
jgi:hypothetical protein